MTEILYTVSAIVVGVLSSARITRLIVDDTWPPVTLLRAWWATKTQEGPWYDLLDCHWCAAPWIVAGNITFATLTDLHAAWWILNGWMAASLATSWLAIKTGE